MISRADYENQQRARGLIPDSVYGPSGNHHPYDFEPDSEACTVEEAGHYGAALALAAEGLWVSPEHPLNVTVAGWGWGICRYWFTEEQYQELGETIHVREDEEI